MQIGDRVALDHNPDWIGTVTKMTNATHANVDFDDGAKGKGLDVDDLRVIEPEPEPERQTDDKSWPPSSLETKVPKVQSK